MRAVAIPHRTFLKQFLQKFISIEGDPMFFAIRSRFLKSFLGIAEIAQVPINNCEKIESVAHIARFKAVRGRPSHFEQVFQRLNLSYAIIHSLR